MDGAACAAGLRLQQVAKVAYSPEAFRTKGSIQIRGGGGRSGNSLRVFLGSIRWRSALGGKFSSFISFPVLSTASRDVGVGCLAIAWLGVLLEVIL